MSSEFQRRFQGRTTTMNKAGISGMVKNSKIPIQKAPAPEFETDDYNQYNPQVQRQQSYNDQGGHFRNDYGDYDDDQDYEQQSPGMGRIQGQKKGRNDNYGSYDIPQGQRKQVNYSLIDRVKGTPLQC